jgi:hypothetical protein
MVRASLWCALGRALLAVQPVWALAAWLVIRWGFRFGRQPSTFALRRCLATSFACDGVTFADYVSSTDTAVAELEASTIAERTGHGGQELTRKPPMIRMQVIVFFMIAGGFTAMAVSQEN